VTNLKLRSPSEYANVSHAIRAHLRRRASMKARDLFDAASQLVCVSKDDGCPVSGRGLRTLVADYTGGSEWYGAQLEGALKELEDLGLAKVWRSDKGRLRRLRLEFGEAAQNGDGASPKREGGDFQKRGRSVPKVNGDGASPKRGAKRGRSVPKTKTGTERPRTGDGASPLPPSHSPPQYEGDPLRDPSPSNGIPIYRTKEAARAFALGASPPAPRGVLDHGLDKRRPQRLRTPSESDAEAILSTFDQLPMAAGDPSTSAQAVEARKRELLSQQPHDQESTDGSDSNGDR